MRPLLLLALMGLCACKARPPAPVDAGPPTVVSEAILNRPVQTRLAVVRHILIGWRELAANYRRPMHLDRRARTRDRAAAEELVRSILERMQDGEDFAALEKEFSEDPLSADTDQRFEVRPDGALEPEFQALSLRLNPGEVGVCQSAYGFHLVQRVQ